jgi:glutaredoxin
MLELYQTEWCPASRRVREHLTELGVDYLIHQVPVERDARAALRAATGADTIPALYSTAAALSSARTRSRPISTSGTKRRPKRRSTEQRLPGRATAS